MDKWNKFYKENCKLDELYEIKYSKVFPDYYRCNALGFIIELGEFVNETKCFKYWSIKKPNKDDLLEEFADALQMILCLANNFKIKTIKVEYKRMCNEDILNLINETYRLSTDLMNNGTKELCLDILDKLLDIANILNLEEDEVLDACYRKIEKNKMRLASDY